MDARDGMELAQTTETRYDAKVYLCHVLGRFRQGLSFLVDSQSTGSSSAAFLWTGLARESFVVVAERASRSLEASHPTLFPMPRRSPPRPSLSTTGTGTRPCRFGWLCRHSEQSSLGVRVRHRRGSFGGRPVALGIESCATGSRWWGILLLLGKSGWRSESFAYGLKKRALSLSLSLSASSNLLDGGYLLTNYP
jgi:hypothetical protein